MFSTQSKDCTVLVNSCDKYKEAWFPFFELLKINWKDCPFEITLNTETLQYEKYGIRSINVEGSWGERLALALRQIDTPYIIFLLEDFFIQGKVKTDEINKCINYMKKDDSIACFYFNRIIGYQGNEDEEYEGFFRMNPSDDYNDYIINCQAALWDRNTLIELAEASKDPWEFEVNGYINNKSLIHKKKFYCSNISHHDAIRKEDIFSYLLKRELGYGIWKSKWLWNNHKLFKRYNINVQYKDLGKMSYMEFLMKYKISEFFKKSVNYVKRRL